MARRGRPPKKREITIKSNETKSVIGILSLFVAALFILSYFVDAPGFDQIHKYLGEATFLAFIFFANFSLKMFNVDYALTRPTALIGQFFLVPTIAGFLHFFAEVGLAEELAEQGMHGGVVGYFITYVYLIDIFAREGAFVILLLCGIIFISLTFSISIGDMVSFIGQAFKKISEAFKQMDEKLKEEKQKREEEMNAQQEEKERMIGDFSEHNNEADDNEEIEEEASAVETETSVPRKGNVKIDPSVVEGALISEALNYPSWKFPPVSLLNPSQKKKHDDSDIHKNSNIIEETLQSFGVKARVVDVLNGPSVTQYALNIALGTKVSRISNLKTDLALALAAPTGSVRIEAPIPGTSYIGIEIPNRLRDTIVFRELLDSDTMKKNNVELAVTVGKSIAGKDILTDLVKMPHLLIAGATGSGKSVLMNSFITSLLMKKTPDEVRMIMVDPKQVELSDYDGIPHLLTSVITDMQKVLNSLKWAIIEMEKRYTIFRQAHVRNIQGYNKKMGFAAMPYIIIIIDEMADLMLSSGAEVETAVVKLAQKARATGIHLVLATQRPSVDVLTGLIKANIPGRVGMSVATQIDSRVILDQVGAETLLGKGDMLFKEPDKSKPFRVQGVWIDQDEIRRVVKFIKSQAHDTVHYEDEVTKRQAAPNATPGQVQSAAFSEDEYFADAVQIVCNAKKGSASLLQRKLSIGYNRAARLLDELQQHGVVGEQEGSKPRKVLISDPENFLSGGKNPEEK